MIKALIFDMDNTIIDRQKAFKEGVNNLLHRYFSDEDLINKMADDIITWDKGGTVERIDTFTYLVDKYQITSFTPKQLESDWSSVSGSSCYLFDDVRETLEKLHKKYKIAILSNGHIESQRRKLKTIDIDDLIDYSLIADEYICWKPDPRIYIYTCEKLGCKPDECVYIGDNYKIDVIGSSNAGLTPIFVNRTNENHPDVTSIRHISELLTLY